MDGRDSYTEIGIPGATGDFDALRPDHGEPDRPVESAAATDGDGAMVGRVLIYASIVVVVVAMVAWKRLL